VTTARCADAGGASVVRVAPVAGARTLTAVPSADGGLHLVDANIALGELAELVRHQIHTWLRSKSL
jgi:hypothetical protein